MERLTRKFLDHVILLTIAALVMLPTVCQAQIGPDNHTNGGIVEDSPILMASDTIRADEHVVLGRVNVKNVDNERIARNHKIVYYLIDSDDPELVTGNIVCFRHKTLPGRNKVILAYDLRKIVNGKCPGHRPD